MSEQDGSVERIVADWQEQVDRGLAPPFEDVIRAHPGLEDALRQRFQLLEGLRRALADVPQAELALRPLSVGRYVGFRRVAEGGMGIVFWALDTDLGREVAFKVVQGATSAPERADPGPEHISPPLPGTPAERGYHARAERFLDEARITAGLSHPGIVPVHELGRTPDGVPYYTMRFLQGDRTFAQAIEAVSAGPFDARLALLEPFLRVCDTIEYAHSHGVLHRDLKPQNVALGEYGEVVVLDWGVAKVIGTPDRTGPSWRERSDGARASSGSRTASLALGTPGWMSPEAARGALAEVAETSDIYSLGAMLFQILAGRLPFEAREDATILEQVLACDPPSPSEVEPGVPGELAALCARCLARSPAARPQRVAEVSQAVRRWQAEAATAREVGDLLRASATAVASAQPLRGGARLRALDGALGPLGAALRKRPEDPEALRLRALTERLRDEALLEERRRGRRRLLSAVAVLLTILGGVSAVLVTEALRGERDDALRSQARAERAEAETQRQLRLALLTQARERRVVHAVGARASSLEALGRAAAIHAGADVATEAIASLVLPDLVLEQVVDTGTRPVKGFCCTRDGARLAWCDAEGRVVLRPLDRSTPDRVLAPPVAGELWTLRFDPMGRVLACKGSGDERVRLYDAVSGALRWTDGESTAGDAVAFDPRGDGLALGRPDGRVDLLRLGDLASVRTWRIGDAALRMQFSPDGRCLAVASGKAARVTLLAVEPPWTERTTEIAAPARALAWSPDGRHLLLGGEDEDLHLLRVQPGSEPVEQALLRGHRGVVSEAGFARGGDLAFSIGWDETLRVWDPWVGVERLVLPGVWGWLWLSADDARLGCLGPAGQELRIYRLEPGRLCRHLPWDGGPIHGCALSPDGRKVAVVGESSVGLWDVSTGELLSTLTGGGAWGAAFAPDGALLTSGAQGLTRHAVDLAATASGDAAPGRRLWGGRPGHSPEQVELAADGALAALALRAQGRALVLDTDDGKAVCEVAHPEVFSVALSPDGRRLATGTWRGAGVRLWETASGRLVGEVPTGGSYFARADFSADGQWLVACDAERLRVLRGDALELVATRAAPPRFETIACHPREPLVAASDEQGQVHLLALPDLTVLEVLPSASGVNVTWLAFDGTGSRLAATSTSKGCVCVWDLRALASERARRGLSDPQPVWGRDSSASAGTRGTR